MVCFDFFAVFWGSKFGFLNLGSFTIADLRPSLSLLGFFALGLFALVLFDCFVRWHALVCLLLKWKLWLLSCFAVLQWVPRFEKDLSSGIDLCCSFVVFFLSVFVPLLFLSLCAVSSGREGTSAVLLAASGIIKQTCLHQKSLAG